MRALRIAAYQLNADVYCPACIGLVTYRRITLNWDDPPEIDHDSAVWVCGECYRGIDE